MASEEHTDWERVGTIGVDAGLCWIGDPCYVKDGVPWGQIEEQRGEAAEHNEGVCVSTGYGDGSYGVFVRYVTLPFWGKRVAAAKVVFIPDADDDSEREGLEEEEDDDSGRR